VSSKKRAAVLTSVSVTSHAHISVWKPGVF